MMRQIKRTSIQTVDLTFGHEEAERLDRQVEWAKTPTQRLSDLEFLRQQVYGDDAQQRLQRVAQLIEFTPR